MVIYITWNETFVRKASSLTFIYCKKDSSQQPSHPKPAVDWNHICIPVALFWFGTLPAFICLLISGDLSIFSTSLTLRPFLFKIANYLTVFMACYGDKTRILTLLKNKINKVEYFSSLSFYIIIGVQPMCCSITGNTFWLSWDFKPNSVVLNNLDTCTHRHTEIEYTWKIF